MAGRAGEAATRSVRATRTRQTYTMDGVSVEYPDWHFNVRASNTEPLHPAEPGGHDPAA